MSAKIRKLLFKILRGHPCTKNMNHEVFVQEFMLVFLPRARRNRRKTIDRHRALVIEMRLQYQFVFAARHLAMFLSTLSI